MADDFISGALAGQQYQLNKFLIQEAPLKVEQEKLALDIGKADFNARQKLANMLATKPPPAGQDPLENAENALLTMGSYAAQVGLPEQASKDLASAGTIAQQRETAAYQKWQEAQGQAKFSESILANVHDQASLDLANKFIELQTGKKSALEGQKYSPELIETLKQATETHRTKAQEDYDRARAAKERTAAQVDIAKIEVEKTQVELNRTRAVAAGKVGAPGLAPKAATLSAVTAALQNAYGSSLDPSQARTLADPIALETERIMKEEGKTRPQAVSQAIQSARKDGALAGIKVPKNLRGTSMKSPLPPPKDPSNPEAYQDGLWYDTPAGPRWWDAETQTMNKAGEEPEQPEENE